MAEKRRNAVAIQFRVIASTLNSLPIVGSAMFTEKRVKGVRKDARVTVISTALLKLSPPPPAPFRAF